MSSLAANDNVYSVIYAQQLGDKYKSQSLQKQDTKIQCFLSAKLCYSLVTKTGNDHPINIRDHRYVDKSKLSQLETFKKQHNININDKQEICPREALLLLRAFYSPWLTVAKFNLKQRSGSHIEIRHKAFIQVYEQMGQMHRNIINNQNAFISHLEDIKHQVLKQQHDYIDNEWKGPDFRHLQLQKLKGVYLDELTAVYDKKGYLKRCNNSQEDWLRKYIGEFLAKCIQSAKQVFGRDAKMELQFGLLLLQKKVRFNSSRDTDLIPGGWIFGPSCDSLANALTQLLHINIKNIKQNGGRCKSQQRETLLNQLRSKLDQQQQQMSMSRSTSTASITPPPRPPPPSAPTPNTNINTNTNTINSGYNFHPNKNNYNYINNCNNTMMRPPQKATFNHQRQVMMNNNGNHQQSREQQHILNLTQENRELKEQVERMRQMLNNQSTQSQSSSSYESIPATPTAESVISVDTAFTRTSVPMPQPPPPPLPPFPVAPPLINVSIQPTMTPMYVNPTTTPSNTYNNHQNQWYGYGSHHGSSRSVTSQRHQPYPTPNYINSDNVRNDANNGNNINNEMVYIKEPTNEPEVLYGAGTITQYETQTPYLPDPISIAGSLMASNGGIQSTHQSQKVNLNSLF